MSKAHMPPVPPANRTTKGPGPQDDTPREGARTSEALPQDSRDRNLGEQGRQGNIKQNTTHQGYTQDR
ncbi:hypothetical protein JYK14_03650 [Siccirubricoccus sp. KC 17139]|uniref:Uncharacterized protein n=1 Tax=Siccirubricoccus soli TaxID=2899147 RepID=A0ABT1D022_9PROT|nr:hypothetical protein [Siccirubricoccus soli]MCO6415271.1 hypothetical protein [Siccirubricoccus soli]MCP2681402.1 hypothetical protein [Siccirubricoccus soli]